MSQTNINTKNINGYGDYTIDTEGNVYSLRSSRYLHPSLSNGYEFVRLYNKLNKKGRSHKVHRLVAQQFLDNPERKRCVNHLDGNRRNNRLSNLDWVTHKENKQHSIEVLGTALSGFRSNFSKLNENSVVAIHYLITRVPAGELAKAFRVTEQVIDEILVLREGK